MGTYSSTYFDNLTNIDNHININNTVQFNFSAWKCGASDESSKRVSPSNEHDAAANDHA